MTPVFNAAHQQNSWVQREEVSSRRDAKNAKESTILFQPINDASDPVLQERFAEIEQVTEPPVGLIDRFQQTRVKLLMNFHRKVNDLLPNRVCRHSVFPHSPGVLGAFASWR